mgnify:CR=1 FL=1
MKSGSNITVAITGATGLVGKNLAFYLKENGYHVIAIGRSREKLRVLEERGIDTRIADVGDENSLKEAFKDVEVVVHAAGSVDPFGSRESIFATNYGGTQKALSAAAEQGVTQFIHISSLSVITGQGDQYNVDEQAPLRLCGESYADSKVEAENWVMNSGLDIAVTALRPGFIYGPGERAWLPRLIHSIEHGRAMLIDGGLKETNVIYVGNLSKAIESAILNAAAYNEVYNLTDGQKISKKQLFDAIADGMELPRVNKKIPSLIAKIACESISSIAPYLPENKQRKLSRFSRAAFRLAGVNQGFSIAKAEKDLNYTKRTRFEEGMKITLQSFKEAKETRVRDGAVSS